MLTATSRLLITGLLILLSHNLLANPGLTININQGNDQAAPIAVVPFGWSGKTLLPVDIAQVIQGDLERSGLFQGKTGFLSWPHQQNQVYFRDWQSIGADYLLIGQVETSDLGYKITYELYDVYQQRQLLKQSLNVNQVGLRQGAHYISDQVFEKLTGVKGAFSTQIALVLVKNPTAKKPTYQLWLTDASGVPESKLLESHQPIMSPTWSPDGKRLAYVSFQSGRPAIYIQDVSTGKQTKIISFPGLNSSPAWSPDGQRLAVVLSKDGTAQLYIYHLAGGRLERITRDWAINTEPSWLPDGKSLLFTSNRGGKVQIYRIDLATKTITPLTFGSYSARSRALPNGDGFIFVNGANGKITEQDFNGGPVKVLTNTAYGQSPSVSPNGLMIAYSTGGTGQGKLAFVSLNGKQTKVTRLDGDVRFPCWSPYKG
jgi:TolB protein